MAQIKLLGIHGSPIKNGNCAYLLDHSLEEARKEDGIVIEKVALAGLNISDCIHCNWCIKKQTADQLCALEDDAIPILRKIRDCDVLLLVTPVYFARLSGIMACMLDRTRCFIFGRERHLALRGKVGIAMAVGWFRNGGIETTLESLHNAFLLHEMWTPSVHAAGAIFGVGAVSGLLDPDQPVKADSLGLMADKQVLRAASKMVRKAIKTAKMINGPEKDMLAS
jgi:multimeric flavodoxin WrbA